MIAEREKLKAKELQNNCLSSITHPSRKFSCFDCKRQITNHTMVFAQNNTHCIQCFANQKKFASHYHIINKLEFPIFQEDWSAKEELLLFQGLEKHGFGNWNEISEHIDSNKSGENVQKHYNKIYLSANGFIPEPNSNFVKKDKSGYKLNKAYHPKTKINKEVKNRITTNSIRGKTKEPANSKQSPVQIVGFMPLRKDFQFQYDNEAELLLAEMEFSEQDTAQEMELKFKTIQIYNKRLTERTKRKEFVISRGLLDLEKQTNVEKMRSRNEKQIYNMMKCFSRFQTAEEHEQLVQGIIREKQLKQTIQEYKDLRNKGFLTKEEIDAELERRKQAKTKKKNTNEYGYAIANYDLGRNRRQKDDPQTNGINKKNLNTYFNADELELCRSLKLSPIGFMMIKETILREYAKLGSLQKDYILNLFNVEKYVVVTILNSMVSRRQVVCRG